MLGTEDRLKILDLLARYNYAIDDSDGPAWAACFTPDGVFKSPIAEAKGTEELRAYAENSRTGTLHFTSNEIIEGNGDEASMRCYLQLVRANDSKPQIIFCGRYKDELRKTASGWRFARRTVGPAD